jgi:hypothetical protein
VSAGPVLHTTELCAVPEQAVAQRLATGETPRHIAAGNVVLHRKLFCDDGLEFDPFFDRIGGEDFDFFNRSAACGNHHIWVAEAVTYEYQPASRRTLRYVIFRHFTGGINSVLRSRRSRGNVISWLRFMPKIIGKLLAATISLAAACFYDRRKNFRDCVKKTANAAGYLCGLCNIVYERYRKTDGY